MASLPTGVLKYCGPYQQKREVKGRTNCPYTRKQCPWGLHACEVCGAIGHGAEECWLRAEEEDVEGPPQEPAPPLPAMVATSKQPATIPVPAMAKPQQPQPEFVPGFGKKGEGKGANYGIGIPPPCPVPLAHVPLQQPSSSSAAAETAKVDHPASPPRMPPPPIMATTEEVEEWLTSGFKKLKEISTKSPPEVGESVLWRELKTGKQGGQSTKVEHFNGKVHGVIVEDGEVYLYID